MRLNILPHYIAIGVSEEFFWDSCPTELKAYEEAHKKQLKEQNMLMWLNGMYISNAIMSTIGNSTWFRGKNSKLSEYPKEPFDLFGNNTHEITEEEKQREVDKFFAQESVRRANWKRTHKK